MNVSEISLQELAAINLYDSEQKSCIKVPEIQRGLVWDAYRIEMLWDSILRDFPIGSLLLIQSQNEGQELLLDGQQRVNAIINGFSLQALMNTNLDVKGILWLDIANRELNNQSHRVRLTTLAHPWGYQEDGKIFNVAVRREYITKLGLENIPKTQWDIRYFWPYSKDEHSCFIPLSILTNAPVTSEETFYDYVLTSAKRYHELLRNQFPTLYIHWGDAELKYIESKAGQDCIKEYFPIFHNLSKYKVVACHVCLQTDEIETLFNRVNTGGMNITQEELAYAVIKMCWPEIVLVNKKVAATCMPEEKFASLAFRYLYSCYKQALYKSVSANQIREWKNDPVFSDLVQCYYASQGKESKFEQILKELRHILIDNTGFPSIVLTEIAYEWPDLYLVLLRIVDLKLTKWKDCPLSDKYIVALCLYVYCAWDKKYTIVIDGLWNLINRDEVSEDGLSLFLNRAVMYEGLLAPCSDITLFKGFQKDVITNRWSLENYQHEPYFQLIQRLFRWRDKAAIMMKRIAQCDAYKTYFQDYDPAQKMFWEHINRPWDEDHIFPVSWLTQRAPWYHTCKAWIWSIGNSADIPMEQNRSKNNNANWDFYLTDKNQPLYWVPNEIEHISNRIVHNESMAKEAIEIIKSRFFFMYQQWYNQIAELQLDRHFPPELERVRDLYMNIPEEERYLYKLYYLDNTYHDKLFEEGDDYAWKHTWITIGCIVNDQIMKSLTFGFFENTIYVQSGYRKHPQMEGDWWPLGEGYFKEEQYDIDSFLNLSITNIWNRMREIKDCNATVEK